MFYYVNVKGKKETLYTKLNIYVSTILEEKKICIYHSHSKTSYQRTKSGCSSHLPSGLCIIYTHMWLCYDCVTICYAGRNNFINKFYGIKSARADNNVLLKGCQPSGESILVHKNLHSANPTVEQA